MESSSRDNSFSTFVWFCVRTHIYLFIHLFAWQKLILLKMINQKRRAHTCTIEFIFIFLKIKTLVGLANSHIWWLGDVSHFLDVYFSCEFHGKNLITHRIVKLTSWSTNKSIDWIKFYYTVARLHTLSA